MYVVPKFGALGFVNGFVRSQDKELHFDMVIRSLTGLPKEIQEDIARIYNNMGEITGYTGSLTFQNVREFPVNPMQDIAESGGNVMAQWQIARCPLRRNP